MLSRLAMFSQVALWPNASATKVAVDASFNRATPESTARRAIAQYWMQFKRSVLNRLVPKPWLEL